MRSCPRLVVSSVVLGVALAIGGACTAEQQNNQGCLKNDDCESRHCVQYLCVQPGAGAGALPAVSPTPAPSASGDASAADAADGGLDAPMDTGPDSGRADAVQGDESGPDAADK